MAFLAPAFLAGLFALGIPILIHLLKRDRNRIVEFPSLMFLRQLPTEQVRRRRIHNWPLLLLRIAALIFLVAAFSRPFLDRAPEPGGAFAGAREVVILVDRSYSMGYGDRWERARAAATEAIDRLEPGDRATMVVFAVAAEALTPATGDRSLLRLALDSVRVEPATTRYGPALRLARSILEASDLGGREVVLISDFQRLAWESDEPVRLPEGTVVTPVAIGEASLPENVGVTGVTYRREEFSGRERLSVVARLANKSARPVTDLRVALEVDGRELQSERATIEPSGSATVAFAPFTLSDASMRATVRITPDALPHDDVFHLVLSPGQALSVLILEGAAGADPSLYLRRALEIGGEPGFRVETIPMSRFRPADLEGRAVVVLNDVPYPGGDGGRQLRAFVERGGGLLLALGENSAVASEFADLLPGVLGRPVDRPQGRSGALGFVDYAHAVFEPFRGPRSGDFTGARFFRYRAMSVTGAEGVLARLDDGATALAEKRAGQGSVLVWTSALGGDWNDLALQPVFLPFVHQLVRHAAGYEPPPAWYTVGDVLDLSRIGSGGAEAAAGDLLALTPSGARVPIATDEGREAMVLEEQGVYEIRGLRGRETRPYAVAVNVDPAESDLSAMDPAELAAAVAGRPGERALGELGRIPPEDLERRQGFWWYLLVLAFLMLAGETVLSNRARARTA